MEGETDRLELIQYAIHKLLEERKSKVSSADFSTSDYEDQILLSRLLSQLEAIKRDEHLEIAEDAASLPYTAGEVEKKSDVTKDIVEELRELRRQNTVTHWLLSLVIFLTFAWQMSEVTLLVKFRNGISHPFRSLGDLLEGWLKGGSLTGKGGGVERLLSRAKQNVIQGFEARPFPTPKLPTVDFSYLGLEEKVE